MRRKPLALANWKMAMTLAETRAFVEAFVSRVADVWDRVHIVICPPFTAVHTLAQALAGTPVPVGAQNLHPGPGEAFTGEVSAELLADAGARWVLLGHWERRRHFGETDALVNRKVHAALDAGLRPILLKGKRRKRGKGKETEGGKIGMELTDTRWPAVRNTPLRGVLCEPL